MSSSFIAPIVAVPDLTAVSPFEKAQTEASTGIRSAAPTFGQLVTQGVEQLDSQLKSSQIDLQALATGETGDLHRVMIKLEESRLGFQLMLQVRNRLLESYQEVMRMQI